MSKKQSTAMPPTYSQFISMADLCSQEVLQEYYEILRTQPRPAELCGEEVPETLNMLSYGQLDDMRDVTTKANDIELAINLTEILFGHKLNLYSEDVNKVFGFINFCTAELKRINKIFTSLKPHYSSEEIAAGIEKLDFGSFGVLDWYAKRMGITNQNEVRSVAWVRIYQCMKNDHEQQMFEKRLHDVYMRRNSTGAPNKRH